MSSWNDCPLCNLWLDPPRRTFNGYSIRCPSTHYVVNFKWVNSEIEFDPPHLEITDENVEYLDYSLGRNLYSKGEWWGSDRRNSSCYILPPVPANKLTESYIKTLLMLL